MGGTPLKEKSRSLIHAEETVDRLGFPIPEKPLTDPNDARVKWPSNVADLSPYQLAEHLSWWSGWSAYARYHVGAAETNVDNFDAAFKLDRDTRLYKSKGDYNTVTEALAAIVQSPDMVALKQKLQRAKAVVIHLNALLAGYEEKYTTISREISRRQLEFNSSKDRGRG